MRTATVPGMEFVLIRHGQPEWVRDGRNVVDPPGGRKGIIQDAEVEVEKILNAARAGQ